ncbi:MAG: class II glutamine amidotransferase, partial [Nitrospira sp.]
MCGIVGYIGDQHAVPILLEGLAKLEYRGYDSSGVAVLQDGMITVRRSVGKLANLQKLLKEQELKGTIGIGHTRWATHGKPSEQNAHPHRSKSCVLVHNGIIENYQELKYGLERDGYKFQSETDTEVVAHLIDKYLTKGQPLAEAVRSA